MKGTEFDALYKALYEATRPGRSPSLTALCRNLYDLGVRATGQVELDLGDGAA